MADVVFPVVGEDVLQAVVDEHEQSGGSFRERVFLAARSSYRAHYRALLAPVLETVTFESSNTMHRPILDALATVARVAGSHQHAFGPDDDVPLDGIVPAPLRRFVVDTDRSGRRRVHRIGYEVCLLQALRDRVRCKEIRVDGSQRWRNPDEDLPTDFEDRGGEHYQAIGKPLNVTTFLDQIRQRLESGLDLLDRHIAADPDGAVRITTRRGGWITVEPLAAQPEPENLTRIKQVLNDHWPETQLLDVLKETELRLGLTDEFAPATLRSHLPAGVLQRRLLLCLYAYGTNTGFRHVAAASDGDSEHDLHHVRRRHINPENLRRAITTIVNATRPRPWSTATRRRRGCTQRRRRRRARDVGRVAGWFPR